MTDRLERLAMDICWAEFIGNPRKAAGCSKTQYWKKVTDEAKVSYRKDAERLMYWTKKLGVDRLQAAVTSAHGDGK
jgi:hypothetical protein